jgi:hypothetical protein
MDSMIDLLGNLNIKLIISLQLWERKGKGTTQSDCLKITKGTKNNN